MRQRRPRSEGPRHDAKDKSERDNENINYRYPLQSEAVSNIQQYIEDNDSRRLRPRQHERREQERSGDEHRHPSCRLRLRQRAARHRPATLDGVLPVGFGIADVVQTVDSAGGKRESKEGHHSPRQLPAIE